jgi:hypothetical protein
MHMHVHIFSVIMHICLWHANKVSFSALCNDVAVGITIFLESEFLILTEIRRELMPLGLDWYTV